MLTVKFNFNLCIVHKKGNRQNNSAQKKSKKVKKINGSTESES